MIRRATIVGEYRYSLERIWDEANSLRCLFILLNPSTADDVKDDPTVRRCCGFAMRRGCGGLTIVNLFALRATNPRALLKHRDPVGPENDETIKQQVNEHAGQMKIAAWGAHGARRASTVLPWLYGWGFECFGKTRNGQPKHILYQPYDRTLYSLFDKRLDYLAALEQEPSTSCKPS